MSRATLTRGFTTLEGILTGVRTPTRARVYTVCWCPHTHVVQHSCLDVKSCSQFMHKSSVLGDLCAGNVAMRVVGPQGLTSCSGHNHYLSSCAPRLPHRFTCPLSWLTIISIVSIVHPSGYLCHSDFLHVNPDTSEKPESGLQCTLAPSKSEDGWLKDACTQQLR